VIPRSVVEFIVASGVPPRLKLKGVVSPNIRTEHLEGLKVIPQSVDHA
jgi:hypothetical protein